LEDTTAKPLVFTLPIECKDSLPLSESLHECCARPLQLSVMQVASDSMEGVKPINANLLRLKRLKQEHNLAKAVKSDNVEVPIHIWNNPICGGMPTAQETQVIGWVHCRILTMYRRWLLRDVLNFLSSKYGRMTGRLGEPRWQSGARSGPNGKL
jgi:hypothetical protein